MQRHQTAKLIGEFKVVSELGKGSFGTVYKAKNSKEQIKDEEKKCYAIKQNIGNAKPMLHLQSDLLKNLKIKQLQSHFQKGYSIPQVLVYQQQEYFSYMVMDLFDATLEDFVNKEMKNILSKDCLIRIFYSILKIIQNLHYLGYVHRDIKPANFMLKLKKDVNETTAINQKYQPTIFPIDLGLSKSYINPITRQHILCKQNKKMVGTAIFCSLNTHQGIEQSRRDDIQSVVYLVTYLVKKLPWEIVANKSVTVEKFINNQLQSPRKIANMKNRLDAYDQIYQIKNSTDFDIFFKDSQLIPSCFLQIYKYTRKLSFEQQPNYQYIYGVLQKQHFQLTGINLQSISYECKWENLCLRQENKINQSTNDKKKIKINFKIPPNKIKKIQLDLSNKNQSLPQTS